ncbi:MAG: hypothetical protein R6V05_00685 [Candidatus Brocadiia bacterium]
MEQHTDEACQAGSLTAVLAFAGGLIVLTVLALGVLAPWNGGTEPGRARAEAAEVRDSVEPELAEAVQALRSRAGKARTGRYKWVVTRTVQMATHPGWDPDEKRVTPPPGFSEELKKYEEERQFILDGHDVRAEWDGQVLDLTEGQYVPWHETLVCVDGEVNLTDPHYQGTAKLDELVGDPHYVPVLMAHRMFDPVVGVTMPERLSLQGQGEFQGHPCVIAEAPYSDRPNSPRARWWFSENQGYSVIKQETRSSEGTVMHELHMRYEPDPEVGWRLASWESYQYQSGFSEPASRSSAQVTQALFNEPVSIQAP